MQLRQVCSCPLAPGRLAQPDGGRQRAPCAAVVRRALERGREPLVELGGLGVSSCSSASASPARIVSTPSVELAALGPATPFEPERPRPQVGCARRAPPRPPAGEASSTASLCRPALCPYAASDQPLAPPPPRAARRGRTPPTASRRARAPARGRPAARTARRGADVTPRPRRAGAGPSPPRASPPAVAAWRTRRPRGARGWPRRGRPRARPSGRSARARRGARLGARRPARGRAPAARRAAASRWACTRGELVRGGEERLERPLAVAGGEPVGGDRGARRRPPPSSASASAACSVAAPPPRHVLVDRAAHERVAERARGPAPRLDDEPGLAAARRAPGARSSRELRPGDRGGLGRGAARVGRERRRAQQHRVADRLGHGHVGVVRRARARRARRAAGRPPAGAGASSWTKNGTPCVRS